MSELTTAYKQHRQHCSCHAAVERLEKERDGFRDRGVAVLEAQAEETAKALRDLIQAEAQAKTRSALAGAEELGEAVGLLRDIYERGRFSKSSDLATFLEKDLVQ